MVISEGPKHIQSWPILTRGGFLYVGFAVRQFPYTSAMRGRIWKCIPLRNAVGWDKWF